MCALIINFHFAFRFCVSFFFVVIFVLLSMEQTHASEAGLSDSALYRDASMAKLEMFLEKAKLLVEERISLGSSTTDKRRKAAIDEELPDIRARRSPPRAGPTRPWASSPSSGTASPDDDLRG